MNLAVVAYPRLDEIDRQGIESYRAQHDPQAFRIGVHFTLVFPVDAVPGDVATEVAAVAQSTPSISFAIRRTTAVRDTLGSGSHIFLVADEGGAEITTMHRRLYAGTLRPHLRADIPFVPHMTVGAAPDVPSAEKLVAALNARSRIIRGTIEQLDLIEVTEAGAPSLAAFALAARAIRAHRGNGFT